MPDICMCHDDNCPSKNVCYRFMAIPSQYLQSYFLNSPRLEKSDTRCEYFMEIYKEDKIKK